MERANLFTTGQPDLSGIGIPAIPGIKDEGRYAGSCVTGAFTSTAYTGTDAPAGEVFSMAMEFFSEPMDALKLIDGDPQHAAIILRSIRPKEYAKDSRPARLRQIPSA